MIEQRSTSTVPQVIWEFIDSGELALRWNLPESWVRDQVRRRTPDPLPHVRSESMSASAGVAQNWRIGQSDESLARTTRLAALQEKRWFNDGNKYATPTARLHL